MATALVVGATGALGSVLVRRLIDEGFEVIAVGRDAERLQKWAWPSPGLRTFACDVRRDEDVRSLVEHLGGQRLRLLVHSAAAPVGGSVLDVDPQRVLEAIDIKVNGLLRLVTNLRPLLVEGGRVVAIGGLHGFKLGPDSCLAGLANSCQAALVRQLSWALGDSGICVLSVAPGPVETQRFAERARVEAARRGLEVDEVLAESRESTPLRRLATAEEVAWIVSMLASEESIAMTGSVLFAEAGTRREVP